MLLFVVMQALLLTSCIWWWWWWWWFVLKIYDLDSSVYIIYYMFQSWCSTVRWSYFIILKAGLCCLWIMPSCDTWFFLNYAWLYHMVFLRLCPGVLWGTTMHNPKRMKISFWHHLKWCTRIKMCNGCYTFYVSVDYMFLRINYYCNTKSCVCLLSFNPLKHKL